MVGDGRPLRSALLVLKRPAFGYNESRFLHPARPGEGARYPTTQAGLETEHSDAFLHRA